MQIEKKRAIRTERLSAKFIIRRAELARAALLTISRLGYARSSLREIAQNSEFSHGVLHYYFEDKTDLILCSVREFKTHCIARYEALVEDSASMEDFSDRLTRTITESVRDDAPIHRFWYDLRAEALFEPVFLREIVEIDDLIQAAVARVFARLAVLTGYPPRMAPQVGYAIFDGLFQRCILKHTAGDANAVPEMLDMVRRVIEALQRDAAR